MDVRCCRGWLFTAITCALLLFVVVLPTADVLAFGLHEHTAAMSHDGDARDATHAHHARHASSHHCDFSMTPGEVPARVEIPAPIAAPTASTERPSPHVRAMSFVPTPPPRS